MCFSPASPACPVCAFRMLPLLFLLLIAGPTGAFMGPRTEPVPLDQYAEVRYVLIAVGSDNFGNGSIGDPWYSVVHALNEITDATEGHRYVLLVARGTYGTFTVDMKPWVDLFGGFAELGWTRDLATNETILDGEGLRRVVNGAADSRLDGFTITRGARVDRGGGLNCHQNSPVISNNIFRENTCLGGWGSAGAGANFSSSHSVVTGCLFIGNRSLGPDVGRGGALTAEFSALIITNNVMVQNVTIGTNTRIGGAMHFSESQPVIVSNTIVDNTATVGGHYILSTAHLSLGITSCGGICPMKSTLPSGRA